MNCEVTAVSGIAAPRPWATDIANVRSLWTRLPSPAGPVGYSAATFWMACQFLVTQLSPALAHRMASMVSGSIPARAGVVSVGSNQAPAEMVQIVELCERGDFAAARKLHHWLLPLIQVNFLESNPIPCKAAMAAMGLLEESYRLPLVPPTHAKVEAMIGASGRDGGDVVGLFAPGMGVGTVRKIAANAERP